INLEIGLTSSMITAALSILLLLFVFIRFIAKPGGGFADSLVDRTFWAWIGLVLAVVVCVGAWMNMRAAGEGLEEAKAKLSSMTQSSGTQSTASTAAPAAPAPPVETPAPPVADEAPPSPGEPSGT